MSGITFEWILGAIFVGFNAYGRYNTPTSNRESTTFQNFTIYFLLYFLSVLIVYVVLGALFDSSPETIAKIYGAFTSNLGAGGLPKELASLSAPMVSALFLSTLLPSLPWLSRYDKALLQFFWDKGHIPNHVHKMAAIMRRAPFNYSPQQRKELKEICKSLDIDYESLNLAAGTSLDYRWARVNVLIKGIEPWEEIDTGRLRRYVHEHKEELGRLRAARDDINREFSELRMEQLDSHALAKMHKYLDKSIAELFRNTSVFVAKAICVSEFTKSGRSSRISQLGFDSGGYRDDKLSPRQLAKAVLCILLTFLTISILQELGQEARYRKFENVWFMTFLMAFTYGASLIIALHMKAGISMGYNELTRQRPVFAYLWVALATGFSWFFVSIGYRYIPEMLTGLDSQDNLGRVLEDIGWSYPFALQSMALAISISAILDVHQSSRISERIPLKRRLVDVAFAAGVLALASVMTYCWMEGVGIFEGYATKEEAFRGRTSLAWLTFKGAAVGAVVGWLVPMWFNLNRIKVPEKISGRLISMNRKGLADEIRSLEPDDLLRAVAAVAASVASINEVVNRSEIDVYLIICGDLAGLPNSDVDTELAESEFRHCLELIDDQQFNLEERLGKVAHLPLLRALMPYIASSIAFADGVYLDQERQAVDRIRQMLTDIKM